MVDTLEATVPQNEVQGDKPEFHIDSDDKAEWLLRKLGNLDAEISRVSAQAASIIGGLQHEKERLLQRFQVELEEYCKSKLSGRSKTVKFLQGSCAFRTVPGGLRLINHTEAEQYAKNSPAIKNRAFVLVESFNPSMYLKCAKEWHEQSGERLPGTSWVEDRESFLIKFPKAGEKPADPDQ